MDTLERQVDQAAAAIRQRWDQPPQVGIILGTGLGQFADQVAADVEFDYADLPHFHRSTALSHKGQLVCGRIANLPVCVMRGRVHLYEGYTADQVTLPVRVMHELGASTLIVSNASGGLNPYFAAGDLMVVEDHIDLMGRCPTLSANTSDYGRGARIRYYDEQLIDQALAIGRREGFAAPCGVYVGLTGPNYETRAEYRMLRRIGGDAVGMSTVPEVLVAGRLGMRVLALSTITNAARPDAPEVVDAGEVVDAAALAEPKLSRIVLGVLANL